MPQSLANSPGIIGKLLSSDTSENFSSWLSDIDLENIFKSDIGFTPLGGSGLGKPADPRFGGMNSISEFIPLGRRS